VCKDCETREGCKACSEKGCLECETENGFYLYKGDATKGEVDHCRKCKDALLHCVTCSNAMTCTKCKSDFFKLHGDGECRCDGGDKTIIDPKTNLCTCEPGYYLTSDGCVKCGEAIKNCMACSPSYTPTQISLADSLLQPNGKYLQCS